MSSPNIDERNKEAIEEEIKALASVYLPQWNPKTGDPGWALAQSFAKMTEDVIKKLNEVPQKLFIDYLNRLDFTLSPPLSARAPVTFTLAKGAKKNKVVPSNTQVSDEEKNIFETENAFSVTPANLNAVYSTDKDDDGIYEHFSSLEGEKSFFLFDGESPQEHFLYFGDDSLFNVANPIDNNNYFVRITPPFNGVWQYYGMDENENEAWMDFDQFFPYYNPHILQPRVTIKDRSYYLLIRKYVLKLQKGSKSIQKEINGKKSFWIRTAIHKYSAFDQKSYNFEIEGESTVDALFYNDVPIELDQTIYPFGYEPKRNDTFYIASKEAFSKRKCSIELEFSLERTKKTTANTPQFSYEYWNGKSWKQIKNITIDGSFTPRFPKKITFDCPEDIEHVKVNNELNYWLRIKLIGGIYGNYSDKGVPQFQPPFFEKINIKISENKNYFMSAHLLAYNNLQFSDLKGGQRAYQPILDKDKTLYLGFDQPFGEGLISILFSLSKRYIDVHRYLEWKYYSQTGWKVLNVKEGTNGWTQTGSCEFIAPLDQVPSQQFSKSLYWIKIAMMNFGKKETVNPLFNGIYLNTVWAMQSQTITDEIVGGSDGSPGQVFQLSKAPARELKLWVKEPYQPEDASLIYVKDEKEGYWVLWHEVESFYDDAGASSRVYQLDPVTAKIYFGNALQGMIPPIGKENIKADYKTGGGEKGNVSKGAIKNMVSTIPTVNNVYNYVAAAGGSDTERVESLLLRAPKKLKNSGRAIIGEDYENLAKEASADIATVKVFPNRDKEGNHFTSAVSILAVPYSRETKPLCSEALMRSVETYIKSRAPLTAKIYLLSPDYIDVSVTVKIALKEWHLMSQIKEEILKELTSFLHPIYGGFEKRGWEFGVLPCYSDFFTLFENIEGITYIKNLMVQMKLKNNPEIYLGNDTPVLEAPPYSLLCSGIHKITFEEV